MKNQLTPSGPNKFRLLTFPVILLLVVFFVLAGAARAQLDPAKLSHFPELDGNLIHDVISDRQGVLWIATQSGLVKFDGNEYTRFHPIAGDSTTIGTVLTTQLHEDRNGYIWVGCMYDIYRYNPKTKSFKIYPYAALTDYPSYRQPVVYSIASGQDGRIWFGIGSFNGGTCSNALLYYDEKEDRLKLHENPDSLLVDAIFQLTPDSYGNIWIMSMSGSFNLDPGNQLHLVPDTVGLNNDPDEFINGMASTRDSCLWITTNHAELYRYDQQENELTGWSMAHLFDDMEFHNYEITIASDLNGDLWLGTRQGLVHFNRHTEKFEIFGESGTDRLQGAAINCLHFDSFDNLWIGTLSVGLLKYVDRNLMRSVVQQVNDSEDLTNGWVMKILESADGTIWIDTHQGLNAFHPGTESLEPYYGSDLANGIYNVDLIMEVRPGELLLQTSLGHGIFNTADRKFNLRSIDGIPDDVGLTTAKHDRTGTLWFGSYQGLYVEEPEGGGFRHIDLTKWPGTSPATNQIANFLESPKHGFWISTNDGLFLYDYATGEIERHAWDPEKGNVLTTQDVNSIYEDPDGLLWVGPWLGGLCAYDPETGKVKTYTISDGLPSMSIQGILGDEKNKDLWLSTFAGISRFNIEEGKFYNFSLDDGIQGLLHSDGAYFKSSDGTFFFGGNNGFTYFDPDVIARESKEPMIYITDFKVADRSVDYLPFTRHDDPDEKALVLAHGQNNISIDYIGIQYDNPDKNIFAYTLENYDNTWREVGNLRAAFYYNLPAGSYTFRVKGANSNGLWNEEGAILRFRILPPWWKTWWAYVLYGLLLVAGIMVVDRIQRRRIRERERRLAREKELEQAKEIEKAYHQLKQTQTQLLHAEKMASLGELTAGIAHEIQNPLNFVNNFSEVSTELIEEMKEEMARGSWQEAAAIADDIRQNLDKISHHGKRADAIVKGMLQHSRSSNGQKEPTDLNALADEYLRLSYHGLRAKDKSFNADFRLEADDNLPKVNVVPQDMGRVLLNLINNAFYTVDKKAKRENGDYKPMVTVRMHLSGNAAEIHVTDNGEGIPEEVQEKIFQPFFSTKPTGEGTGLGLSLSYDIVTKGHGGTIDVRSKPGEGTEFIIRLPVN